MDILGPFPLALGKLKFLIVLVDYFIKWIKVEALVKIRMANTSNFFKNKVLAKYEVPKAIVTDNMM